MLGQSVAYIRAINNTPIMPQYYNSLMNVALVKGAQSTTAIEGNTLSDEEINKLRAGEKLPPSKEYQEREVKNILDAFNEILYETVYEKKEQLISAELLLRFHKLVGKELGEHFEAIPGKFRENDVVVGTYRGPDYRDVPELINKYCDFLKEFNFQSGKQLFSDIIIQAIVAHVYLEWIHPFGDGNGRTGRLVEFYILSRGGNPDISLHILSNHYNNTRPEYYRQLDKAGKTKDLSEFLEYAIVGFRDGLAQILDKIQESQMFTTWQRYVYDKFNDVEIGQREVFKRRRRFGLDLPLDTKFSLQEIPTLNITMAHLYSGISEKTLLRDIEELLKLDILKKEGNFYFANISAVNKMFAKRKGLVL
jgi:Fic family protein